MCSSVVSAKLKPRSYQTIGVKVKMKKNEKKPELKKHQESFSRKLKIKSWTCILLENISATDDNGGGMHTNWPSVRFNENSRTSTKPMHDSSNKVKLNRKQYKFIIDILCSVLCCAVLWYNAHDKPSQSQIKQLYENILLGH